MSIFYRPDQDVVADVIPFFWKGDYHLFYLKDYRDPTNYEGMPWFHVVTRDFVHFEDWGEAIPVGTKEEQDRWVFTGAIIEKEGLFYAFYTAHNAELQTNTPRQGIMLATSHDLRTWIKHPTFMMFPPEEYDQDDWRDPHVFWNEEADEYWMLLAARKTTGPSRHRGCIALAASPDLLTWEMREPFWAPDEYITHECPDVFQIGDWWYLVYSTFSERTVTHYRISRSLNGPWLAPANDTFDSRAYYAAKTASDGRRRFAFGWLPTKTEEKDSGTWEFGGNLVAHELIQQPDGTLDVRVPEEIVAQFTEEFPLTPTTVLGEWGSDGSVDAIGRHSILSLGELPQECLIEATITLEAGAYSAGLMLRADETWDNYHQIRLEPSNRRMVIDRWKRPGDEPFIVERPLDIRPNEPVKLRAIVSDSALVLYANDKVALSSRMYDPKNGEFGLFATECKAHFTDFRILIRE